MANKQEVVRSLHQSAKICPESGVPTENLADYFWWKFGHVQQRVPSTLEFYDGRFVLPYLLFQSPYGFDIGFTAPIELVRDWLG